MSTSTGNLATHGDPMIGEILGGRYLVERLIDRGGMGLVYLATEVARERHVVIKMLAPHWTEDADAVARFDREGERLAELEHPNIVEMYDFGRAGDQAYIAMEYIDGEPLRRYLKRNERTNLREFAPIAVQVLEAVGFAHAHEIMLRDIKPSNIMLCERDGKASFVKLLDFGLAKLVGGDDVEITKAHVVGTAGYLSPEQIRGEPIDVRVDVYALGVLFFVMLTGKSPIEGDNDAAILYNHVHGAPRRLVDELPAGHGLPEGLIALIHQCLAKDPNDRPADARALAEALRGCLPSDLLELPEATEETREAVREYRESKLGLVAGEEREDDDLSAEWTRPVLRKPEAGEPSPVQAGTWKNLTREAQAAAKKKPASNRPPPRSAGRKGNPTRVGLAAVGEGPAPVPAGAKPDARRGLRRTGPRKIVRTTGSQAAVERPKSGGIEATRPAGSGRVGAENRGVTRPDGSGHVRRRPPPPRPPPPQPPEKSVPRSGAHDVTPPSDSTAAASKRVAPVSSAPHRVAPEPSAPQPVVPEHSAPQPVVPESAPSFLASDDSIPIMVEERERSRKMPILVGVFLALALGTFAVVAFVLPRGGEPPAEPGDRTASVDESDRAAADTASEAIDVDPVPADPPVEKEMARLEVTGPEGAEVLVDGESHGSVPQQLELSVGRHQVEVKSPRHEPWRTEVDLVAGDNPAVAAEPRQREAVGTRKPSKQVAHDPAPASVPSEQPKTPKPAPRDATPPPPPPPVEKTPPRKPDPQPSRDDDPFLPVGKNK
jgi:serine/threonine protein kinase